MPADPTTPASTNRHDQLAVPRQALIALCALYELVWHDIETLEADQPGYVLLSTDDDQRLNDACEAIEPWMPNLQTVIGTDNPDAT